MPMLPQDSPFRNLPATMEPRQLVGFDGLRYIFDMLSVAYDRLLEDLASLTKSLDDGRPTQPLVASAFHNAWSVVDSLYRLYQLLHDVRGLKRTPPLEVFLRALEDIEDFRHGVQHLDDRISACAEASIPLWGTLRWFYTPGDPNKGGIAITLVSGSVRSGNNHVLNPLGRSYFIPIGLVTLDAFGKSVELSDLIERTRRIAEGLDRGLRTSVGTLPQGGADLLIGVSMAFDAPEPAKDAG
jgi:hypothetical protein